MKEWTTKREEGRREDREGGVETGDGADHVSPSAGLRTGHVR